MKQKFDSIYLEDAKSWRKWLENNHNKLAGIWLIYYKKHTNKTRVPYNEAVEEALCFGWIDSTVKRIDDERYMQQFTPRNLKSNWSEPNKKRVNELIQKGKMTQAGLRLIDYAKETGIWDKVKAPQPQLAFSDDLFERLKSNQAAFHFYSELSPSSQKQYKQWVMSTKKPETRIKRCHEMIDMLQSGQKIGMK